MTAFRVGRRNMVAVRYRLLLFDDRVEEVGETMAGLELRRLFFDEVETATVHRASTAAGVLAGATLAVFLALVTAVSRFGEWHAGAFGFALLTVAAIGLTVYAAVKPPYDLTLRAGGHTLETRLPRGDSAREEAIGRLVRTIERYQKRVGGVAAEPAPSPSEEPPTGAPREPTS